jgi:hypothetical protein
MSSARKGGSWERTAVERTEMECAWPHARSRMWGRALIADEASGSQSACSMCFKPQDAA